MKVGLFLGMCHIFLISRGLSLKKEQIFPPNGLEKGNNGNNPNFKRLKIMHISREKGLFPLPDFVSYHKSLSGFLFHDRSQISGCRWFSSNAPYRARQQFSTFCDLS